MPKRNDHIQIQIEKLVLGGRGLGFHEGVSVFAEDTVPGDRAEVKITTSKKRFAEASLEKIIEPSKDRIAARCKHFGTCGGCAWQFLPYEKQIEWKEKMVRETLEHVGGFANPPVEKIIDSEPWFYRNKMEWSFDGPRGGFHIRGRWHDVVNVEECFLQSEKSVEIFKTIRDFFATRERPRSVYVREGKRTGEMMVVVLTQDKPFDDGAAFVENLRAFPEIVSIAYVRTGTKRPFHEEVLYGKSTYREEMHVGGKILQFEIRPQAFFQPNTLMAEKIYEQVLDFAQPQEDDVILDLFCGTGTIGLCLAPFAREVVGVELDKSAIESARENANFNNVKNISFHIGMVQDILPNLSHKPQIIVVDPPRAGIAPQAVQHLVNLKSQKIVYVSCNPASFARDAKVFTDNGYRLCTVQPFDQFPQTAHIETVSYFTL